MTDECSKRTESEEASGPGAFVAPKLSNASKISPLNGIETRPGGGFWEAVLVAVALLWFPSQVVSVVGFHGSDLRHT